VFHTSGHQDVARLEDAHRLLAPMLGTTLASVLLAVALLCSGQASTITGTLAGQIVMEGSLRVCIRPWLRRLISRGLAIIPAVLFIALRGAGAVDDLLVFSQVVLSLQLSFAVIPLITFTSDRSKMGVFASPPWVIALAVLTAVIIVGNAPDELARLVNASGADLLITGSHGHRLLQDILHGATASGVRHRVRCPVLTVPGPEPH
jgi:manganese transport protein